MKDKVVQTAFIGLFVLAACTFDNNVINVNTLHKFVISLLVTLLLGYALFRKRVFLFEPPSKKIVNLFLVFILTIVISSLVNNSFLLLLNSLTTYIVYFLLFWLFLQSDILNTKSFKCFVVALTLSGTILVVQFFLVSTKVVTGDVFNNGSLLSHRIFITEYLLTILPFVTYLFLFEIKTKGGIFITGIIWGLLILTILVQRSRMGILVLFITIGVLLVFVVADRKQNRLNIIRVNILVVILSIAIISDNFLEHPIKRESLLETIKSISKFSLPENTSRLIYWKSSIKMFLSNPLLGVGTGNWFDEFNRLNPDLYDDYKSKITSDINSHNSFLQLLSETGIIPFVIVLFFFIAIILKAKEKIKQDVFYLAVILSMANVVLLSLVNFTFENLATMSIFFIGAALIFSSTQRAPVFEKNVASRIIFFALALCLMFFSYKIYQCEKKYLLALKHKAKKNYVEVIRLYEEIPELFYPVDPNKIPIKLYLGSSYFELGYYQDALSSYESARDLTPNLPSLLNNIAITRYKLGDTTTAINSLGKLCSTFRMYIEPEINLLIIYFNNNYYERCGKLIADIESKCWDTTVVKNYYIFSSIANKMKRINETFSK